jgi:hypothetical protein
VLSGIMFLVDEVQDVQSTKVLNLYVYTRCFASCKRMEER